MHSTIACLKQLKQALIMVHDWHEIEYNRENNKVRNDNESLYVSKLIDPIFKRKSHCLQDALESRQVGRTFKLVNPKQEDQVSV